MKSALWTDENVALLRRLIAEGYSAGEAGRRIGGSCTRATAIGKARRLGLRFGLGDASTPDAIAKRASAEAERAAKFKVYQFQPGLTNPRAGKEPKTPKPKAPKPPRAPRPRKTSPRSAPGQPVLLANLKTIFQLGRAECRWPLQMSMKIEADAETLFCAAPVRNDQCSYCSVHARRAYTATPESAKRFTGYRSNGINFQRDAA